MAPLFLNKAENEIEYQLVIAFCLEAGSLSPPKLDQKLDHRVILPSAEGFPSACSPPGTVLGALHPCFISLITPLHEEGLSPLHKPESKALRVS